MAPFPFPREVLSRIFSFTIDYEPDGTPILDFKFHRGLPLVCRDWNASAQQTLFARVKLHSTAEAEKFIECVELFKERKPNERVVIGCMSVFLAAPGDEGKSKKRQSSDTEDSKSDTVEREFPMEELVALMDSIDELLIMSHHDLGSRVLPVSISHIKSLHLLTPLKANKDKQFKPSLTSIRLWSSRKSSYNALEQLFNTSKNLSSIELNFHQPDFEWNLLQALPPIGNQITSLALRFPFCNTLPGSVDDVLKSLKKIKSLYVQLDSLSDLVELLGSVAGTLVVLDLRRNEGKQGGGTEAAESLLAGLECRALRKLKKWRVDSRFEVNPVDDSCQAWVAGCETRGIVVCDEKRFFEW